MKKLRSIDDFKELREIILADYKPYFPTIVVSAGTCGQASGANNLIRVIKKEMLARGLMDVIGLRISGCHGYCEVEPSVRIEPFGTFYPSLDTAGMRRIIDAVSHGRVVKDLLFKDPQTGEPIEKQGDLPFYRKQVRTILGRNENLDPIRIFNYIENNGYSALIKVLESGNPTRVVEEIKAAGLRGRGGAGFPTGVKWEMLAGQPADRGKILVCNADEGDPGAYMDRSCLEGNPHSIIEGMIIGAYGTGANEGVIYVRNEYPMAIKHLIIALRQARESGLLGEDILGTGFSFDITMVRGAGAFVCGEETALMRSIESRTGEPRQRPPFPVQRGVDGKPTSINNVETWANIPVIIEKGAHEYRKVGTENSSGTKIFSLVGKVKNTGLVEVPMGISFQEIIHDIGGGPSDEAKIKAVQTGGPSGGCIPSSMFDLTIDYDSLTQAGSMMGSGGMIIMDESTCMVDVARYFTSFLKDESCGKCFICRKGTQRMYEILDDITSGLGTPESLDLLEELGGVVKDTSMCGLGQTAPNPVLSTLKHFRHEYMEHINHRRCPASICKELVGAPCQSTCPIGTEAWRYVAHISRSEYEEAYQAIRDANPFPSVCARVCHHPCEDKCRAGTSGGQSLAIRALKRFITDRIEPGVYSPELLQDEFAGQKKIAVVGSGPAGLTAAYYLSLKGYKITVFDSDDEPGGMLLSCIPAYRMPRETLKKEIAAILNDNVTLKCGTRLGSDITVDGLFGDGFEAVFLALGAHKSRPLNLDEENIEGINSALRYLKAFNLKGENLARGQVGVIGGGNSAVDAARVALRQKNVDKVTIFYRRTRKEMPALHEEIEAALEEGITILPLVSPVKILSASGQLSGVEFIKNKLGDVDSSGRRRPVAVPGTEYTVNLDTLLLSIGDMPDVDYIPSMDIDVTSWGTIKVDPATLVTSKKGVFAGGDVVTGPNTVVEAIADGKKVAVMIARYLRGQKLEELPALSLPDIYIKSADTGDEDLSEAGRIKIPTSPVETRTRGMDEVEITLTVKEATLESRRCLRCDLEFTEPKVEEVKSTVLEVVDNDNVDY